MKMVGRGCRASKREDGEDGQHLCRGFVAAEQSQLEAFAKARALRTCAQRSQIREKFLAARASSTIAKVIAERSYLRLRASGGGARDQSLLH